MCRMDLLGTGATHSWSETLAVQPGRTALSGLQEGVVSLPHPPPSTLSPSLSLRHTHTSDHKLKRERE